MKGGIFAVIRSFELHGKKLNELQYKGPLFKLNVNTFCTLDGLCPKIGLQSTQEPQDRNISDLMPVSGAKLDLGQFCQLPGKTGNCQSGKTWQNCEGVSTFQ